MPSQRKRPRPIEQHRRKSGAGAATHHQLDVSRQRLVKREAHLARIDAVRLDRKLRRIGVVIHQSLFDLRRAVAGGAVPARREQRLEALDAKARIRVDVAISRPTATHQHVRFVVHLDVLRIGVEIATLSGVAIQARAYGDDAVDILKQLHRRARAVEAGYANVVVGVRQPVLGHQCGADQRANPLRELNGRTASVGPHRASTDQHQRLLGSHDQLRRALQALRIRIRVLDV